MKGLAALLAARGLPSRGLVHVGAHQGQHVGSYLADGFDPVVLIEPNPALAERLAAAFPLRVIAAAAAAGPGWADLHLTVNDQLSSLYRPRRLRSTPVRVPTVALREVLTPDITCAVVDVQGAELDVVRGAPLEQLQAIVLETRTRPRYAGAPLHAQVIDRMAGLGWAPILAHPHGDLAAATVFDVVFTRNRT